MAVFVQNDGGAVGSSAGMAALEEAFNSFMLALPQVVAAIIILFIGWFAGMLVARIVRNLVDSTGLDRRVRSTPLGRVMGGTERGVAYTLGALAKWFIYALAILAAANMLDIAILSQWISSALTYLPAFVAGLLIIMIGFVLADFIGNMINRTQTATRTVYTGWFAEGVRIFLYFIAITIGLDTMGIDVNLLYIFAEAAAWGVAIGIALAVGIGFGWGIKDHVAQNIDSWTRKAKEETSSEYS